MNLKKVSKREHQKLLVSDCRFMDIKHIYKRIGDRNWENLTDIWLNFLPSIEFPISVDPAPTSNISNLIEIKNQIIDIENRSTIKDHYYSVPGLHSLIFQEAVYLFYKSLNVLRSAQSDLMNGFKTWSIANTYQSSYFMIRCLLNLLGVHFVRVENKDILVDLCPSYSSKITKKEVQERQSIFECRFQLISQPEHWHVWTFFQKTLEKFDNNIISEDPLTLLQKIEPKDFAKQRNRIMYHNTHWTFDDLKKVLIDADFGIRKIDFDNDEDITSRDDFSVVVSFLLTGIGLSLFNAIADEAERLREEVEIMNQIIEQDDNSYFNKFVEVQELA